MSGITVVSPADDLGESLAVEFKGQQVVRTTWSDSWPTPTSAVAEISAASPDIVVLGPGIAEDDAHDLLLELDRTQPQIAVIAMVAQLDTDRTVRFLRGGAREVLDEKTSDEVVSRTVNSLIELLETRRSSFSNPTSSKRRVIAFLSPKGGTGKTTISVNVAVGLAAQARNQVLLVDLDTQFGDAAPTLGIEPEFSLANLAGMSGNDRASMKVFLSLHSSSLAVLSPPDDFASAEALDGTDLKVSLAALSEEFPYLVIDTAAGIDDFSLLAMEFASDLVFVATPDAASIRAVRRQLEALDQLGLVGHRRHLVINRSDTKAGLSSGDIEQSLGMKASVEVPTSRLAPLSANQGTPLIDAQARDAAIRPIRQLIDSFLPESTESVGRGFRFFRKD